MNVLACIGLPVASTHAWQAASKSITPIELATLKRKKKKNTKLVQNLSKSTSNWGFFTSVKIKVLGKNYLK